MTHFAQLSADENKMMRVLIGIVDAYTALMESDGANHYMDAQSSRTYTAGHWVGSRMETNIIAAREMIEKYR